ncbi:MAG: hypothetical protein CRN43_20090, partial [Candidatus Nephrothrix sp. EaCA]
MRLPRAPSLRLLGGDWERNAGLWVLSLIINCKLSEKKTYFCFVKQRIYIDTSAVGGYFDDEFKEATITMTFEELKNTLKHALRKT